MQRNLTGLTFIRWQVGAIQFDAGCKFLSSFEKPLWHNRLKNAWSFNFTDWLLASINNLFVRFHYFQFPRLKQMVLRETIMKCHLRNSESALAERKRWLTLQLPTSFYIEFGQLSSKVKNRPRHTVWYAVRTNELLPTLIWMQLRNYMC